MEWLAALGRVGLSFSARLGRANLLLVAILRGLPEILRRPRLLLEQLLSVGVLTVLIIAVSGIFVGMVLGLQGYYILSRFGAEATLGVMVAASLVRELGLEGRVQLLGMRSNPWKYMASAAAVVLPSRTEAFPNVIGEALALGVPVIAAACSAGIAEYLDNGNCGVMVRPDDVASLAGAMESLLGDPALRLSGRPIRRP